MVFSFTQASEGSSKTYSLRSLFFLTFRTILRATLFSVLNPGGVKATTHNSVTQTEVFDATATYDDHRVLLQLVSDTGNICGDLHAVREAYASNLPDSGVRLARGHGRHLRADTPLERRREIDRAILNGVEATAHCHRFGLAAHFFAAILDELVDRWHIAIKDTNFFSSPRLGNGKATFPFLSPYVDYKKSLQKKQRRGKRQSIIWSLKMQALNSLRRGTDDKVVDEVEEREKKSPEKKHEDKDE